MCSCAYTCTSQVARGELRAEIIGIIDVGYKRIGSTNRKPIANHFSITTRTRRLDKEGSEMTTLNFVTQVCFVSVQTFQKMSARKSHGDGSDCPLCSLHDGDFNSLHVAQRLSLFGYRIHKFALSEALKTCLEASQTSSSPFSRRRRT